MGPAFGIRQGRIHDLFPARLQKVLHFPFDAGCLLLLSLCIPLLHSAGTILVCATKDIGAAYRLVDHNSMEVSPEKTYPLHQRAVAMLTLRLCKGHLHARL